ncbi:hypothetical protein ABZP36_027131 [Zizania latifolia]
MRPVANMALIQIARDRSQVVLELQEDGKLTTSDDPPVVFGSLDNEFIQKVRILVASIQPNNMEVESTDAEM